MNYFFGLPPLPKSSHLTNHWLIALHLSVCGFTPNYSGLSLRRKIKLIEPGGALPTEFRFEFELM